MPEQVFLLANMVITVAYASIMVAIVVPVARAGQLRTNKLAVATSMIFFSCAVGHALHAVMAYLTIVQGPTMHHMPGATVGWTWTSALWDVLTAAAGIYYWSLRRGYRVLLGEGAIYVDPWVSTASTKPPPANAPRMIWPRRNAPPSRPWSSTATTRSSA
ncbi:hypothetical protein [Actinoplanes sp. NPDC049802]|uniref:hypothetical protein n=1 Tax=Actinoplanes sp. NPDC049802 TaxID=3154742 RepID=UPI0033D05F05